MILVDQTAVPLATPDAIRDLGGSLSESQWLLTANILPLAAFMVLGGRLGDLFGLKRVFLTGGFVFVVSTALAGSAQDMPWMISARVAQGCGAALMMPTAVAIVSNVFPRERRGMALGVLAGGSASPCREGRRCRGGRPVTPGFWRARTRNRARPRCRYRSGAVALLVLLARAAPARVVAPDLVAV
jgi:hypothetical protein